MAREHVQVICAVCKKVVDAEKGDLGDWKPVHHEDPRKGGPCAGYWRHNHHEVVTPEVRIGMERSEERVGIVDILSDEKFMEKIRSTLFALGPESKKAMFTQEQLDELDRLLADSFNAIQDMPSIGDLTVEMSDFFPVEELTLQDKLRRLLNEHSAEITSNTPDYVLAEYMMRCLEAFNTAVLARAVYYGEDQHIVDEGGGEE